MIKKIKRTVVLTAILAIVTLAVIYGNEYIYQPNSQPVEYIADKITITDSDVLQKARREIQKQVDALNKRDSELESQISVLELEREEIREIKMSFSSALK